MGSLQITEVQADFSKAKVTSDLELELQIGDEVAPKVEKLHVAVILPAQTIGTLPRQNRVNGA